jgi:flagellar biosynthesis/type III secretory pathway protein FliH
MLLKRFLAPIAVAAVVLAPTAAFAQSVIRPLPSATERYRATADGQSPYYEARRAAYDQGYREGIKEGDKDARRGERFTYRDEREFQRADRGYHRSYGDRERYRQTFREGYAAGYSESFDRIARYGNNGNNGRYGQGPSVRGPYPQQGGYGVPVYGSNRGQNGGYYTPAFDNGLRDGFEKGQEDARKQRSHDVLRHAWYRAGDRDYEGRYGSRDEYKNIYRQGFQQGYERGFREGRYR